MKLFIYVLYSVLLSVQIGLLEKKKRTAALLVSLASVVAAVVLTAIFNGLPGSGMMPGLTWFTEVIVSMAAVVVYALMAVISLILILVGKKK